MIRIFISTVLSLTIANAASGFENAPGNWLIKPSVCVTALPGQTCEMQVSMTLPNQLEGKHCLFSNDVEVICWQRPPVHYAFQLQLREDALLELRDSEHAAVFSQQLQVKARSSGRLRRRVRQPWSIF